MWIGIGNWIFRVLISLKLAILLILTLAVSLATGTILESLYDTPTAQYFVYRALWFHGVLFLLGVNILCVAVSRLPWKKRHLPFLLAHAGILLLLFGSWLTDHYGVDGSLRITEGDTGSTVEIDSSSLFITEGANVHRVSIPWIPAGTEFKPISVHDHGVPFDLTVDQYLTHADPLYSFVPNPSAPAAGQGKSPAPANPALHLQLTGGPMRITQDFWLWTGHPSWSVVQMGPAVFGLGTEPQTRAGQPHAAFLFSPSKTDVEIKTVASSGVVSSVKIPVSKLIGQSFEPKGWKGGVKLSVLGWVPDALPSATYSRSKMDYGAQAPYSAIHLVSASGGPSASVWLGLGDRAQLDLGGKSVDVAYSPKRVVLPFGVHLDRFVIDHYEGTRDPSAYSSKVSVVDDGQKSVPGGEANPGSVLISMNEPLHYRGYALYQASYEDGDPRPVTTILSVNQDPGRPWKYTGSLLIVSGVISLFAVKYRKRGKPARA